jgi:hypothetical protein
MSTPRQIAANRLNAQKSSGPRSAQGKAASRANSLKTGLYARSQVIAGEDPAELRALAGQYFLRWEPATPEESFLVATLIDAEWLLRRYSLADAKIWDYQGADDSARFGQEAWYRAARVRICGHGEAGSGPRRCPISLGERTRGRDVQSLMG